MSIPDFFTIVQKSRSFPFKYTVERRVVSLRLSTEDFSIPALCEVGRGKIIAKSPKTEQN